MNATGITAGVDVGAVSTEAALLRGRRIVSYVVMPTGARGKDTARRCLQAACEKAGIRRPEVRAVAATGYGRKALPFASSTVTEITAHARGALHFFPDTESVIDIGGEDSKIIFLARGAVSDFVINDRCAAGTGRFIEVMAHILELPLEEIGDECLRAQSGPEPRIRLSNTCTVFAESEVVALLAKGTPRRLIARALHEAIADRIIAMARGFDFGRSVTLSGGVAKNRGMVACLQRRLSLPLNVPEEPQIVGAVGAALHRQRDA